MSIVPTTEYPIKLINGDCLEVMQAIPDQSVDFIFCDLPYGITACMWDKVIPFVQLWNQYDRICKPHAVLAFTASQPFTTALIMSNLKKFKYCWIWQKNRGVNFQLVKYQPLKVHEEIVIFGGSKCLYNPQGVEPCSIVRTNKRKAGGLGHIASEAHRETYVQTTKGYPKSVLSFNQERGLHPTQKPVSLLEYLIRTYTNECDLVLDNCIGSGTTAIAALNTGRRCIGIEMDAEIYSLAQKRIEEHKLNDIL